jgi:hypothetical protein
MCDHSKCWQYQDINLWVPKKSKKMLKKYRISTTMAVKESGVEISVC